MLDLKEPAVQTFFETDGFRLIKGDCLETMEQLPRNEVDLIFADPPYNLSNGGFTCHAGRMVPVHKGDWDKSKGQETDVEFIEEWLSRCRALLKPSGTIWVSGTHHVIFNVGYVMQKLGYHILNMVTWFKPNASPNLSCRFFTHSTELLIWAAPQRHKGLKHTFNYQEMRERAGGRQMRDVWQFDNEGNGMPAIFEVGPPKREEKRFGKHPTQKPIALLNRIISAASNPGDLVVDPFNGSGTTGIVAAALERRYIGIDMEDGFLDLTKKRFEEVRNAPSQLDLIRSAD